MKHVTNSPASPPRPVARYPTFVGLAGGLLVLLGLAYLFWSNKAITASAAVVACGVSWVAGWLARLSARILADSLYLAPPWAPLTSFGLGLLAAVAFYHAKGGPVLFLPPPPAPETDLRLVAMFAILIVIMVGIIARFLLDPIVVGIARRRPAAQIAEEFGKGVVELGVGMVVNASDSTRQRKEL
jgi:uncharacterized membrane protein HdeD (DUF308 family)